MKKTFLSLVCFAILLGSCTSKQEIQDLSERVSKLEQLCTQIQTDIIGLKALVEAANNHEYITGINPIAQGDEVIGYTISFSKSNPITIYNGKNGSNGKDGSSPQISIKKDTDGLYYWVLNDTWLTDDDSNKIPVKGSTPLIKVENNDWFVSVDEGKTWQKVGSSKDSFFTDVIINPSDVVFVLNDGTKISLPKGGYFTVPDIYYAIPANSYANLEFDFSGKKDDYIVDAYVLGFPSDVENGYNGAHETFYVSASIEDWRRTCINLYVQTPVNMPSHFEIRINLVSKNGGEIVQSETVKCEKLITDDNLALLFVNSDEQDVNFSVNTNTSFLDYSLEGNNPQSWIKRSTSQATQTKGVVQSESITLSFSANNDSKPRVAKVTLLSGEQGVTLREFMVMQCGTEKHIAFVDSEAKRICLDALDKDSDGEISYEEAFTSYSSSSKPEFENSSIRSFEELQYFGLLVNNLKFSGCTSLQRIQLPDYTTLRINYDMFSNCQSLRNITIPSSVAEIHDRAFLSCGLESITIPLNTTILGSSCFYSCKNLTSVVIEKQYDGFGNQKSYTIECIPASIFENCDKLKKIDGEIFAKEIGDKAFMNTDLGEQDGLIVADRIGDYAFYGTKMKVISLSAEYIGAHAFENCSELTTVGATSYDSRVTNFPTLGADAFRRDGGPIETLIIWDEGMLQKFIDNGWTKYFKQVAVQEWTNITIILRT